MANVRLTVVRAIFVFFLAILVAMSSAQFKVDPQKIPIVQAKRRALVIGASNYEHLGKLTYSASDAKHFRDALIEGFSFKPDSVKYLSDSDPDSVKPSSQNILASLDELLKDPILDRGDLFILYFSGHGIGTGNGDFLCATDSTVQDVEKTGLPVKDLIDRLVTAKLRNVVIITDACRAGEKNEFGSELAELAKKANLAVMLGCQPGQKSYESPSLKSGVFTYFLLKSLSNPKNRTESGGLWTSKVADKVSASVFEFTQKDYGDNAQKPTGFADPTSDVMLAKFIDKVEVSNLVKGDQDSKIVSDPKKNADQLVSISGSMFEKGNFGDILEISKQALSLDSENMFAAYYASIACDYLGRTGEHEKLCQIMRSSPDPYFKDLGVVMSDSRATTTEDRFTSLKKFWETSPKDDINALIVWGKARTFLPLSQMKSLIELMLPDIKENLRLRNFFEAEVAVTDGKFDAAILKYREAISHPGLEKLLTNDQLIAVQFPLLRLTNRVDEMKTLIKAQFDKDDVSPTIWVTAAANLREVGNRDAVVAIIEKGIKSPNLTEEEVIISAETIGADVVAIADDLEAQSKSKPYSWKIRVASLIAKGMKNPNANASQTAFEEAEKYCDDELEIISLTYSLQSAVIEDAIKFKNIPSQKFAESYDLFRILFVNNADHIGTDSEKWYQLGEVGLTCGQASDTLKLFKRYIKDFNANATMGSEFYSMLFQLGAAVEDDKIVDFTTNHPMLMEPDRTDFRLLSAAYYAMKGDYQRAKTDLAMAPHPSGIYGILHQSLTAALEAKAGKPDSLKKFLTQKFDDTEANVIARGVAAIALNDLGFESDAIDHLKYFSNLNLTMMGALPSRCFARYLSSLKSHGQSSEADVVLFGSPYFSRSSSGILDS